MKKNELRLAAVCALSLALAACGGGGGGPDTVKQVPSDTTLSFNAQTGATLLAAITARTFDFAAGVEDFGTTGVDTTVTLDNASPSPGFTIRSAGGTASGTLQFGSCIFDITQSTFTSGRLVRGARIVIDPCQLRVNTAGLPADAGTRARNAFLILRAAVSAGLPVQVSVNALGQLSINGVVVATVPLAELTGS